MDQWILSWVPGTFWALLVPVATCAILIYAIERDENSGNKFRHSIRKERQRQIVTLSSFIVVVDETVADECDAK